MKKKILIGLVALVGLFVLAILLVPVFYDVDKNVRPQIESAVQENLNAKAEIGRLSLSLLTGISVGIESFKLVDLKNQEVFFMKDAKLKVPFFSLLGGKLKITVVADKPRITVVKDKNGQINLLSLVKEKAQTQKPIEEEKEGGGVSSGAVAGAGSRVFISTAIKDANVSYKDLATGMVSKIENLTFETTDIGLNRKFPLSLQAKLAVSDNKDMKLEGLLKLKGEVGTEFGDQGFKLATLSADFDLSQLGIFYGNLFKKPAGIPLGMRADIQASMDQIQFNELKFTVNDFSINTKGTVKDLENPTFAIKVRSNKLDISQWKKILKPVSDFDVSGNVELSFDLNGSLKKPSYKGRLSLQNANLKVPGIKPRAERVNANIIIKTNQLDLKNTNLVLGKSDLDIKGAIKNFSAPQIDIAMNSNVLDVDEILGPPKNPPKETSEKENEEKLSDEELDRKVEQLAAGPLKMIRSNPMLRKLKLRSSTKIKKLVVSKVTATNFIANVSFINLVLSLDKAALEVFKGKVNTNVGVDFKPKDPSYKAAGKAVNIDLDQAVKSQFPKLDKFITGRAFTDFNIAGKGVIPSKVKKNLTGKGKFNIANGTWSALTPLKMIGEKLKKIPKVGDKAKGMKVGNKFKSFQGNYTIGGGQLNLHNAEIDLEEAKTALKMKGKIKFNMTMEMKGDVISPLNMPKKLRLKDGRSKVPFELEGPLSSPKVKWEKTINPVAAAYAEDEGKKLLKKGVKDLKKNIKNKEIKKLLDGIRW
jgi:hypothetical protein